MLFTYNISIAYINIMVKHNYTYMIIPHKICEYCGETYYKKGYETYKNWNIRRFHNIYCSNKAKVKIKIDFTPKPKTFIEYLNEHNESRVLRNKSYEQIIKKKQFLR